MRQYAALTGKPAPRKRNGNPVLAHTGKSNDYPIREYAGDRNRRKRAASRTDDDIVCPGRNAGICDNHSIAYCLLGYLCGYYRYYHPMEFATAFLNNAQNDEDIENGNKLMKLYGIRFQSPKWGVSRSGFFFEHENNTVYKGLGSVKFMSTAAADGLYELSRSKHYSYFADLLLDAERNTPLDARQIDILIKIDFFSQFGNQRELFRIRDMFNMFHGNTRGTLVRQIKKEKIDGTFLEEIVRKYSCGTKKDGEEAKSYTKLDAVPILHEVEEAILDAGMEDLSDLVKVKNYADVMNGEVYVSGKESDRRKLYVKDVYPLKRKRDGKQFGFSVVTQSIGSGVDARFTVFNKTCRDEPITSGDIILCTGFRREGQYFTLTAYRHLYE